jgi:hypothetical protein
LAFRGSAYPPPPPPPRTCCLFPTHLAGYILVGLVNVVWMFVFSALKPGAGEAACGAGKEAPAKPAAAEQV